MAAPWRSRSLRTVRYLLQYPSPFTRTNNTVSTTRSYATSDSLPKLADRSVWTSMIPRFIRNRKLRDSKKSKEWNPATFYIVMFTLIGSQAIRMLTLKNSYAAYTRSTDAKIKLLQEVIERIKKGEKVDVEKLLGTGDEVQEREWEEVLQEIEKEDDLWQRGNLKASLETEKPPSETRQKEEATPNPEKPAPKTETKRKLNFF